MNNPEKVLVCITPQSNSKRLILYAHKVAKKTAAELHILHVEIGNNIFTRDDSSAVLQTLFDFGSELGGVVHAICGEDIPKTIRAFVKEQGITSLVLGEPPANLQQAADSVIDRLGLMMPYLKVYVVGRA